MVMRTADSRTDNTNGNFVYYDGQSDKNVHFDETSAAENNLRGATLKKENYKYVFHVSKTDGKVSIKAYGTMRMDTRKTHPPTGSILWQAQLPQNMNTQRMVIGLICSAPRTNSKRKAGA